MPCRETVTGLRCVHVNLMKFNDDKSKDLQLSSLNPKHDYRLCDEWIESSCLEMNLGVLVTKA